VVVTQWKVSPELDNPRQGVWLGAGGQGDGVYLGSLAETGSGARPKVWLSTGKEQVVAVVGKRGSGKSFTLGVIAEGLAATTPSTLAHNDRPRAVLLFDPLDVYWTTRFPVTESDNPEAHRHFALAKALGVVDGTFEVEAWIPGSGNRRPIDPDWFQTLELSAPELGLEEWELLLGTNAMSEPIGQALVDVLALVRSTGYARGVDFVGPEPVFGLQSLAEACDADALATDYHKETLRALRQRLMALHATGLFSANGTRMETLLCPGRLSIVMLGRVPQSYRSAVVAVLTRALMDKRNAVAFAEKRLALDPDLDEATRKQMQSQVADGVPRTLVMLDEAQSFLSPGEANPAKRLFIKLVKEGRNMGLSAVIATQQPSAIDSRVLSQVETFIAHQLVTEADIRAVKDNLKANVPDRVQFAGQQLDFSGLLRQLPPGISLVSSADMNTSVRRCVVLAVRPRSTVHGGIEL
jgi:energy-coupling factor transporter ATP-binding protein EcfA2